MIANKLVSRVLSPKRNVGGVDFGTRIVATTLLVALTVIVLPPLAIPYPLLKIALLTASELGLAILMLGMFLHAKTHYAGFVLFFTTVVMFWATAKGHNYLAFLIGVSQVAMATIEIVTRRSRLNALLGIQSTTAPSVTSAAAIVDAALEQEKMALTTGPPR